MLLTLYFQAKSASGRLLDHMLSLRSKLHAALPPSRVRTARAVTFLEYALMAAVALAIFAVIMAIFPKAIKGLFNSLSKAITGQNSKASTTPGP